MKDPFTVRLCNGWCIEVTFPGNPAGSEATHLVANLGDDKRRADQIAEDCNHAVHSARLDTDRFQYLGEREVEALAAMMRETDMSGEAVMRSALRMYQFIRFYQIQDMELCFRDKNGNIVRPFHHEKLAPYPYEDHTS